MVFSELQSNILYDKLYNWLSWHTPGGHRGKGTFRIYQKNVWDPILHTIEKLSSKAYLSEEEEDFLNMIIYNGPIFRIQDYNPRKKGHIYEMDYYQSWSKSLVGVNNVSNFSDTILLMVGSSINGIDIFGLLMYLFKYKKITYINEFRNPDDLFIYEKEEEITYPVRLNHIERVVVVEKSKLLEWKNHHSDILKENWTRNNLH